MKRIALTGLALAAFAAGCADTRTALEPAGSTDLRAGAVEGREATIMKKAASASPMSISVQELNGLTPTQLAQALVGPGVTISNVTYTGANQAAGTFSGGTGIIGFESGIVLSTGCISNVIGPNTSASITCINNTPGDPQLTAIAGQPTFDASVLEFDFVPTSDRVFFQYVFASDEYNEFVGTQFNDAFGFFVNGVNYATVGTPAVPVTINTINRGRAGVPPTNPELFRNNSPFTATFAGELCPPGGCFDTEMDGVTVVLTLEAPVNPGVVNRMKLAIADAADRTLDSNVFIQAGTLAVCTPIDASAVFSGPPPSAPGTIRLDDDHLFVVVNNVEQFLGRPASPNDVRLGPNFAQGTPAMGFEIGDFNNDGNRDIRLRFSMSQLVNAGHVGENTTQIQVWGRDQTTGTLYCLTAPVTVIPGGPPPPPGILFNNGSMVTHPGAGAGGADVSMASLIGGTSTAGSNARLVPPAGPHFRIGDDFTVPSGGWTVGRIVTHAYQTGGPPTWTGANMNIRSGSVTGPIVATATTTTWQFSGVYRVFNGMDNIGNTQRPVYEVHFDFGSLNLPAGTYWIDWQVEGGVSGWAPYVMQPDPTGGPNTTTVLDNGRQMFNAAGEWQPLLVEPGAETPFRVYSPGASAPATGRVPAVSAPGRLAPDYHLQQHDTAS